MLFYVFTFSVFSDYFMITWMFYVLYGYLPLENEMNVIVIIIISIITKTSATSLFCYL